MWNRKRRDQKELDLAAWQNLVSEQQIRQDNRKALIKEAGQIQLIGAVAKAALDGLSFTHAYGQFKTSLTLAAVTRMEEQITAGCVSPEEQAAKQHNTEEFLHRMLRVCRIAGLQIEREQQQAFEVTGTEKLIDELMSSFSDD